MAKDRLTTTETPPAGFEGFLQRVQDNPRPYFAGAILLCIAVVAWIIIGNLPQKKVVGPFPQVWQQAEDLALELQRDRPTGAQLKEFDDYVASLEGKEVEGYAIWLAGIYHYAEALTTEKVAAEERVPHLKKAKEYLTRLRSEKKYYDLLIQMRRWFSGEPKSPVDAVLERLEADLSYYSENTYEVPAPAKDIVAVLRTELGDIYLQFFPDLAPRHAQNFQDLARAGAYNGTAFHYLTKDLYPPNTIRGINGGDPFSFFFPDPKNKRHILQWGNGGVGYGIDPEPSRHKMRHLPGIVTSLKPRGADLDNGSQFHIVVEPNQAFDGWHTPFAIVTDGMSIVRKISERKTAGEHDVYKNQSEFQDPLTRELLVEAVRVHKVLVYRNGKLDGEYRFPVTESEKTLAGLKDSPVVPLEGEALYAGRKMRDPLEEGEFTRMVDIPFPVDLLENEKDPYGDRKDKPEDKSGSGDGDAGGDKDGCGAGGEKKPDKPDDTGDKKPGSGDDDG